MCAKLMGTYRCRAGVQDTMNRTRPPAHRVKEMCVKDEWYIVLMCLGFSPGPKPGGAVSDADALGDDVHGVESLQHRPIFRR